MQAKRMSREQREEMATERAVLLSPWPSMRCIERSPNWGEFGSTAIVGRAAPKLVSTA
jgi:hypothetical protein